MKELNDNIIFKKSYDFALAIIKIYKNLHFDQKEFVLSKQLLRSGTSIGANVNEAISAESKKDFVHKLHISLKESRETRYWLTLLFDSGYIAKITFEESKSSCDEIIKLLNSIIITTKKRYFPEKIINS